MPQGPDETPPVTINTFAGGGLDRAAHRRKDRDFLAAALADPATRLLPFWQGKHWVEGPREAPTAASLSHAESAWREGVIDEPVFLGLLGGVPHFAVDLSHRPEPKEDPAWQGRGAFVDLRTLSPVLDADTANLFAVARALLLWHQIHRFCAKCGAPSRMGEAGWVRDCGNPGCGAKHFPRTDPVVIMLITDGDRCVLGRQARFPPGFFSCLAGFVEPGESLEDAVARESFEEAGVRVADIRYHSAQPWPFPASLMIGFTARATSFDLTPDLEELEDVRWFDRAWIKANLGTEAFRLPPRDAIARRLLDSWLATP